MFIKRIEKFLTKINNRLDDALQKNDVTRIAIENLLTDIKLIEKRMEDLIQKQYSLNKKIDNIIADNFAESLEYEAVVIVPYRGEPTVIHDGIKQNTDSINKISLRWCEGEKTYITIESWIINAVN